MGTPVLNWEVRETLPGLEPNECATSYNYDGGGGNSVCPECNKAGIRFRTEPEA
jgi:hypothetical protein